MTTDSAPPTKPPGTSERHHREIRSFVRRAGRMTAGQQRALTELWPRYGVAAAATDSGPELLDLDGLFGRTAPRVLEIGFGNGEALVSMASEAPERDFLGVEVHAPGVGHCLIEIERRGLRNVRLIMQDAVEVLRERLPDGSLAGIHLFFPDPWHKKRHHKRRLVQPPFVELIATRLRREGYLHVATDWPPYAEHIAAVMTSSGRFGAADAGSDGRPRTKFEARGERLGHPIWDRVYPRR